MEPGHVPLTKLPNRPIAVILMPVTSAPRALVLIT